MKYQLFFLTCLFSLQVHATDWHDSREVAGLFENAGLQGTFVLYDPSEQLYRGYNPSRAGMRFIPASTFKIPNTLIGLSVGAVSDVDEALPYGGKPQPFDTWEKDMPLREAIKLSNVPIYQELARRIGLESMKRYLEILDYGNRAVGSTVDVFWLEGPLTISAIEQTHFLEALARGRLPLSDSVQKSARDILLMERGDTWALFGKTGWQNAPGPGVGWWVGWVQKGEHVYSFALNVDMQPESADERVALGLASLKALGVL